MKFIISCNTFFRLASITQFFQPSTPDEIVQKLRCVRVEHRKGKTFAIATNYKIAAVEYIGETTEPDGFAHIIADKTLIDQCKNESPFASMLEIITIPEIATASAKTMLGFIYQGNACIFPDNTPMDDWLSWADTKTVTKNNGAMFWNLDYILPLFEASPSGKIVFPAFIDVDVPVVLRDRKHDNWVGLFMPKPAPADGVAEPAVLPIWWS